MTCPGTRDAAEQLVAEFDPGGVDAVVESMERAGVSRKVARVAPLVCVKG